MFQNSNAIYLWAISQEVLMNLIRNMSWKIML